MLDILRVLRIIGERDGDSADTSHPSNAGEPACHIPQDSPGILRRCLQLREFASRRLGLVSDLLQPTTGMTRIHTKQDSAISGKTSLGTGLGDLRSSLLRLRTHLFDAYG